MFWMWAGFVVFVLALLSVDIYVFHRRSHAVRMNEALIESAVWVALALLFSGFIYFVYQHHWYGLGLPGPHHPHGADGRHAVALFGTGYVIEESLSIDNLFVIAVVFGYFAIPAVHQHRVLFWGIIGAQMMRGAMIGLGTALIARFEWILVGFGVFLLFTAGKMLHAHANPNPKRSLLLKLAKRYLPVTTELQGPHFFVREAIPGAGLPARLDGSRPGRPNPDEARVGLPARLDEPEGGVLTMPVKAYRILLTPLAMALLMVETTDLLFAVDSIPATFAVTTDPFLVFTSNIFAVLGLRAMYFALAGVLRKFKYLSVSLAAILGLVGLKMLAKPWMTGLHHQVYWTLALVIAILLTGVIASVITARRNPRVA